MSYASMTAKLTEISPKSQARLAAIFYLLTMVLGIVAQEVIGGRLIVPGDATATAARIVGHEAMFRLGFATYLVEMACQIAATIFFYSLLKPVNKTAAILATTLGLVGCTVKTIGRLFFVAPLLVLSGASYLSVFDLPELQAIAYLFLRVNYQAETIAMVFFGIYGLVRAFLIFRSGFLPRWLGIIAAVGGLGWVTYLYEPLAVSILPFILAAGLLGALGTVLWLLIYGVDEKKWLESALIADSSIWR